MSRPRPLVCALALAAALALSLAPAASAAPPPATPAGSDPSPEQIAAIERYHDSGDWARDTSAVTRRATDFLRARLRHARDPGRLVAVFDIDDTVLSTYDCMKAGGFTDGRRTACVILTPHPAIPQTLKLVRFALRRGVTVAFVTGRPAMVRTVTLAQLRAGGGVRGRYELLTRPDGDHRSSVVPFKSGARRALQRGGRRVVMSVGDQRSDLAGGFAQRTFKLPNPMYTLP